MTAEKHSPRLELEERLRFETLITDLSSEFVNLPSCEVDRKIEDVQRHAASASAWIYLALWQWTNETPGVFKLTHLYRALDGPPTLDRMDAHDFFPWCQQQLLAGRVIAVSSLDELPAEAMPRSGNVAPLRHQNFADSPAVRRRRTAPSR